MKFHLLCSVLLLVPLVFAAQQPPRATIIYSNGLVWAEFANLSEPPIFTYRRNGLSLEFFLFASAWRDPMSMSVTINMVDTNRDENVSFVVEAVEQPGREISMIDNGFCKSKSNSEMRHRIQRCEGELVLREIRPEEISQMEALKANLDKTGQEVYVFYEKDLLLVQTIQLKEFEIDQKDGMMKIVAYPASQDGLSRYMPRGEVLLQVVFLEFEHKRFAVQVPGNGENNCKSPPVPGLRATFCKGNFKITDGNWEHQRNSAPRGIPLDEMSKDELKRLIKDILERL